MQLGAAVVTQVATAGVYVALLAAALTGSPLAGAAVGGTFGLVRAVPVLATRRVRDAGALAALHRRTAALAAPARTATAALLAAVAAGCAAAAVALGSGAA
jgi:sulfite exporter TauE/SafE